MTETNTNTVYPEYRSPINRVIKTFKKFNAYDRAKERKDKHLYEYEEDLTNEENVEHEPE